MTVTVFKELLYQLLADDALLFGEACLFHILWLVFVIDDEVVLQCSCH